MEKGDELIFQTGDACYTGDFTGNVFNHPNGKKDLEIICKCICIIDEVSSTKKEFHPKKNEVRWIGGEYLVS